MIEWNGEEWKVDLNSIENLNEYEKISPFLYDKFSVEKHEQCALFDFENWYSYIEKETFPTVIFPLKIKEAKAIVKQCSINFGVKSNEKLNEDEEKQIEKLGRKIDKKIEEINKEEKVKINLHSEKNDLQKNNLQTANKYFIRLSSRSPKDAIFSDIYKEKLRERIRRKVFEKSPFDFYKGMKIKELKDLIDDPLFLDLNFESSFVFFFFYIIIT